MGADGKALQRSGTRSIVCKKPREEENRCRKKKLEENHIFGETKNIVDIVHVVRQRLKETGVGSGRA